MFTAMLFIANMVVPRIAIKLGFRTLCLVGTLLMLIQAMLFIIANALQSNLLCFIIPMIMTGIGCGIIRPTASSAVMCLFPKKVAGKVIALYNFAFFITSGTATLFSNRLIATNLIPFGIFLLIISMIAFITSIKLLRFKQSQQPS